MEYRILGPLEVARDGRVLRLGGTRERALLAILLLHANRTVSTDKLIEGLWGSAPPPTVAKALQVHVSRLRKTLGAEALVTTPPGYVVRIEEGELDLHRFERLVEQARTAGPESAAATLREALGLWRGSPLADFAYEAFAQTEIRRLEELRLAAVEQCIDADLALGHKDLVPELEALVRQHPLRERLRGQLMLALYRAGRQAESLEVYRAGRTQLREELGIEAGRALRDLERAILSQDPGLDIAATQAAEEAHDVFVGRQGELRELANGLDHALAGRGRLILLSGEPGIGKSRLGDDLLKQARARGADVLTGRCWEAGGAPAFWPWVQSLRTYIQASEPGLLRMQLGSRVAEIAQLVPELLTVVSGFSEPVAKDTEGARLQLFDAATQFLITAAEHRPIVVFLDDLHAADAPSLLLLQYLVRELRGARILVVGAYRNVDPLPGHPLRTMLADVTREPTTRRLHLTGLSEHDVAEYVQRTATDAGSPELAAQLYEETEGNPLFMVEMLRLLALEARPRDSQEGRAELAIPESVQDVIARRFRHLSAETNRVLALASVLGRECRLDALARLAELSEGDLLDSLDDAMSQRILTAPPGTNRIRFTHVLLRDTLYESLTTARRVRLHRLAVETLEMLYGANSGAYLSELAHHAIAGSAFERALDFARRAGDRARAQLAYEEAARLYQIALDVVDLAGRDERVRCELTLAQGEVQILAGEGPTARGLLLQAADLARELNDGILFARATLAYGGRDVWGPRAEWDAHYFPLLEEAIERCDKDDELGRARLLTRAACALRGSPDRERPRSLARQAVEIAQRLGDSATLLYALDGQLAALDGPDSAAERLRDGAILARLASEAGDHERTFDAQEHMHNAAWLLGDRGAMEAAIVALERLVELPDLRVFRPVALWNRSLLTISQGRFAQGKELVETAFRLGEHAHTWIAANTYRLQTYTLRRHLDELDGHEQVLRDSLADYPGYSIYQCALASTYAQLDRQDDCRAIFETLATHGFQRLSRDGDWLTNLCLLSEACSYLGDTARAALLVELLSPFTAFQAVAQNEIAVGAVAQHVGRLSGELGHHDEAEAHFEVALHLNAQLGLRPWLAHAQADYADMLTRRAAHGETTRANALRGEATATYSDLGMLAAAARGRFLPTPRTRARR